MVRENARINQSEYVNSNMACPARKISVKFVKYFLHVTNGMCYTSSTFDEDLLKYISHELADNVGRESDTS